MSELSNEGLKVLVKYFEFLMETEKAIHKKAYSTTI